MMKFRTWLRSQAGRNDSIGKLADFYQNDANKPSNPGDRKLIFYLKRQTMSQPELGDSVDLAWSEFCLSGLASLIEAHKKVIE